MMLAAFKNQDCPGMQQDVLKQQISDFLERPTFSGHMAIFLCATVPLGPYDPQSFRPHGDFLCATVLLDRIIG